MLRQDLGWIDGKNIAIEYRWANGDMTRHTTLVSELASLPVAVIVTLGTPAVRDAQDATRTIPIVVAIMPDPVALGFAESLSRPGGNVTGLANLFEELIPKQLQILRELLPRARTLHCFPILPWGIAASNPRRSAARTLGLVPRVFQARDASDLESVIKSAKGGRMLSSCYRRPSSTGTEHA